MPSKVINMHRFTCPLGGYMPPRVMNMHPKLIKMHPRVVHAPRVNKNVS